MKRTLLVPAALAVIVLNAGLAWGGGSREKKEASPPAASSGVPESAAAPEAWAPAEKSWAGNQPAPEFPAGLEWLNVADPVTLASLKGKVVMLDFWTYGCINCIHNLPYVKKLQEEFADELVVIGIHSAKFANEGRTENLRSIVLRYGITYPVVNDADFGVWSMWGPQGWPTLVLIDPAGNVVGGRSGEGFYETFREIIASLVGEFDGKGKIDRSPLAVKLEREVRLSTLLSFPGKVKADPAGGRLFIADSGHHRIMAVSAADGRILDIAGGGGPGFADGSFAEARFRNPQGMAVSRDGKILYVADTENHAIRAVDLADKRVATIAGTGFQAETYPPEPGTGTGAALSSPWDLALDGNLLYIAMAGSHQLWVMDLESRKLEPLAGSGAEGYLDAPGADAELAQPSGLTLSADGRLYFADSEASSIRWVDLSRPGKPVFTLAGSGKSLFEFGAEDGKGADARFQHPLGVAWHEGTLFAADTYNHRIRRIDPGTAGVTTFAGAGGGYRNGREALFNEPGGIDAAAGKLYVADTNNHTIRVIDIGSGETGSIVLKGYEKFAGGPSPGGGAAVSLAPQTAAPGTGSIQFSVRLPPGFKPNPDAASSFSVTVEGTGIRLTGPAERVVAGPRFPLSFPAEFSPGEGILNIETTLIYCENEKETLCFLERKILKVPYTISAGAGRNLEILHIVGP